MLKSKIVQKTQHFKIKSTYVDIYKTELKDWLRNCDTK